MFNFDDANKKSKEAIDVAVKSYSAWTKGLQAIATEAADYSKKSFEEGVAHVEKLSATKSVEAAFELQTNYIKSSYEGFVAEATKIGEMYADLAKDAIIFAAQAGVILHVVSPVRRAHYENAQPAHKTTTIRQTGTLLDASLPWAETGLERGFRYEPDTPRRLPVTHW